MTYKNLITIFTVSIISFPIFSQSELQIHTIENFVTTSNDTIKNCKIGYRTFGELNKDKNNVVFMPTWHLGTSEDNLEYLKTIVDTNGRYLIAIDALGNGVSSSPSNYLNFPNISIRDMVNSQHELLTNHLKIDHIDVLVGVSMGGIQAFEWMLAFPEYMNQLIAINGTTKASFYDKVLWNLIVNTIEDADNDTVSMNYAMNRITDIMLLTGTSPSHISKTYEPENFEEFIAKRYKAQSNPHNRLAQFKAILEHNIYKNRGIQPEDLMELVKAEVLIIIAEHDHVVNPIYSRELSEILECDLLELKGDCGHIAAFCDLEIVKQAIKKFLN